MKVLVLHPNDELKVISLQKEIKRLFCGASGSGNGQGEDGVKLIGIFPLWIPVLGNGTEEKSAKEIAGEISSVRILSPEITFSGADLPIGQRFENAGAKTAFVSSPVEISGGNGWKMDSQLVLAFFSGNIENIPPFELPEFHLEPKIFRIGDAVFEGNRYYIIDSFWRKLGK